MVSISNGYKIGKKCPVCGHSSVFEVEVYRWWLFYSHTKTNCHMNTCTYKWNVYDRKLLTEKYLKIKPIAPIIELYG